MPGMNTSIENMSMPGMPSLSTQGIPGNPNMNQNMMQMFGNMNLNPNLFAMLPPYQNNYYGGKVNRNMFVRKAKYTGNEQTNGDRRGNTFSSKLYHKKYTKFFFCS